MTKIINLIHKEKTIFNTLSEVSFKLSFGGVYIEWKLMILIKEKYNNGFK